MELETSELGETESDRPEPAFKSGFDPGFGGLVDALGSTEDTAKMGLLMGSVGAAESWRSTRLGGGTTARTAGVLTAAAPPPRTTGAEPLSPFTNTVNTPGASSTANVPQRLGALRPSRRILSTLNMPAFGWAWQSL